MADIGYISLLLALAASIYAAIAHIMGVRKGYDELSSSARNAVLVACGLLTLAAISLIYSFVTHDFQVEYVASYSSRSMSLVYTLSSFWGGNAGSLLFWAWLLAIGGTLIVLRSRGKNKELWAYAASVIMVNLAFFLVLLIFVSNPFEKLPFAPADGRGLNPLLENPGMFLHPPTLLTGYAFFAIPFAFAIAALITRKLGNDWVINIRRWTLLAWFFLGIGNIAGMWWAYVELGWGGMWGWDPVENASLMPWLMGTAFLHSIIMQRRRGMLKVWNMVLIILTFSLTIFGTFLTRSGVISSVHAFGESSLGSFLLVFMGVALIGSLGLLLYRREDLRSEAEMDSIVSRESSFLLNNLILVGATFAILLGTIFPLLSEWVRGNKITVAAPFFNQVVGPIFLLLLALTGVCVALGWRRASTRNLVQNYLIPLGGAVVFAGVLFAIGMRQWYGLVLYPLCMFAIFTHLYAWYREVRARRRLRGGSYAGAFVGLLNASRSRYGGMVVHMGMLILAIGMIGSSFFPIEVESALKEGESVSLGKYTLVYDRFSWSQSATKLTVRTQLSVYNSDSFVGLVIPEKLYSENYEQWITEVAIRRTLMDDLYVILGGWENDGTTTFKVLVNPLVSWMWIGSAVLLVGGAIVVWPDKSRKKS